MTAFRFFIYDRDHSDLKIVEIPTDSDIPPIVIDQDEITRRIGRVRGISVGDVKKLCGIN